MGFGHSIFFTSLMCNFSSAIWNIDILQRNFYSVCCRNILSRFQSRQVITKNHARLPLLSWPNPVIINHYRLVAAGSCVACIHGAPYNAPVYFRRELCKIFTDSIIVALFYLRINYRRIFIESHSTSPQCVYAVRTLSPWTQWSSKSFEPKLFRQEIVKRVHMHFSTYSPPLAMHIWSHFSMPVKIKYFWLNPFNHVESYKKTHSKFKFNSTRSFKPGFHYPSWRPS